MSLRSREFRRIRCKHKYVHDAVNRKRRSVSDRAHWIRLGGFLGLALVALLALENRCHLAEVPSRARLDERHACSDTHAVHVVARSDVVERVEYQCKLFEIPGDIMHGKWCFESTRNYAIRRFALVTIITRSPAVVVEK